MSIEISHQDKVVLVTGAGAGIGREIARWFARAGARVVVNDIDEGRATETAELLAPGGGVPAIAVAADVRDDAAVEAMLERIAGEAGGLDVAVNNVGMMAGRRASAFLDTPVDDAAAIIGQNLLATYRCCRAEAALLVRQGRGGVILNVASGEATRPAVGLASYGAAKAAIVHLTTTLAVELGPHAIRVDRHRSGHDAHGRRRLRDRRRAVRGDLALDAAAAGLRAGRAGPPLGRARLGPGALRHRSVDPGRRRGPPRPAAAPRAVSGQADAG